MRLYRMAGARAASLASIKPRANIASEAARAPRGYMRGMLVIVLLRNMFHGRRGAPTLPARANAPRPMQIPPGAGTPRRRRPPARPMFHLRAGHVAAAVLCFVLTTATQVCAADALTEALQKGLFEEEDNQNLEAAIKAYQDVLGRADDQRRVAATALFRLAECYRKQGKTNEATGEYRRLLRDYADQTTLVSLSRQNLTGLGAAPGTAVVSSDTTAIGSTDEEEREIRRIKLLIKDSPDLINARNQEIFRTGSESPRVIY